MSKDTKERLVAAGLVLVGGAMMLVGGLAALHYLLTVHPDRWTTGILLVFLVPFAGLFAVLFGIGLRVWAWAFESDGDEHERGRASGLDRNP